MAAQKTMADLMDLSLAKRTKQVTIRSIVTTTVMMDKVVKTKKGEVTKSVPVVETNTVERTMLRPWTNERIAAVMQYVSNRRGLLTRYTEGYINSHERFRNGDKNHPGHMARKARVEGVQSIAS